VLAADTQETVPQWNDDTGEFEDYRVTVQKIEPRKMGACSVAIAGSGNSNLIESFVPLLQREADNAGVSSVGEFVVTAERVLREFYSVDVALCPDSNKSLEMFFAVAAPQKRECGAWQQRNVRLCPVSKPQLIGWGHALYTTILDRLAVGATSLSQSLLTAIHVLSLAEQTSNYVRGPMSVAVVKANGIWMEREEYIKGVAERMRLFEEYSNLLLLACADTEVYCTNLKLFMEKLAGAVVSLHEQQIDAVLEDIWKRGPDKANEALSKIPPGLLVERGPDGKPKARHDVDGIEYMCKIVNEAIAKGKQMEEEGEGSPEDENKGE